MEPLHSLLVRQLKRHFRDAGGAPAEWRGFVDAVDSAYREFDSDRAMLERSLELSSQELLQTAVEMRAVFQAIPDLLFHLDREGTIISVKAGTADDLVREPQALIGKRLQAIPDRHVVDKLVDAIAQARKSRAVVNIEYSLTPGGREQFYEARIAPLPEDEVIVIIRNITERRQVEAMRDGQSRILNMIATGVPLEETLHALVHLVEAQSRGMLCSVLLLDKDGRHLRHGAGPSLPADYNKAIDGVCIGQGVGSCGTAAHRREPVFVTDIQEHPYWVNFRELAAKHNLRACWSSPLISHNGSKVLGTFAMYYREVRSPNRTELELIDIAAQIAAIAIERKHAGYDLQHTVSLLQSTLESTADGILVVDGNGRIVLFNERFVSQWGIPRKILQARDDESALTHALGQLKDPEAFLNKVRELYADPEAESFDVIEFKDGRIFERYSCPQYLNGLPTGRVWGFHDITERKRSEEALLKLSRAVEQAADSVMITNEEGVIEFVNPAFEALTGYARQELLGKTPRILKSGRHDAAFYSGLWSTIRSGQVFHGTITNRKKNGELFDVEKTITPVKDAGGRVTHFVSTDRDMTKQIELQAQLRQAQKMEAFGQLAGGVAHDFNNILTVIQGYASMLETEGLGGEERSLACSEIGKAAERASKLTRQLLTFSRRQPIQAKNLDLNDVVDNVSTMLRRLIGEPIAIETLCAPAGAFVHADPGMMEQVLMNLAVNSRDAMPKGGRLIIQTSALHLDEQSARSKLGARPGDFIVLSVKDSGEGIAPEQMAHIFEPFYTTKDVGKGTGLGLATVFGIVQQHHGWIEVDSKLNVGTTFHVYLPQSLKNSLSGTKTQLKTAVPSGTETILLAEDEAPLRELVRKALIHHGYQVHAAASGAAALRIWNEHKASIDVLVTDMVMPEGVNGRELAERTKAEKPNLRVIYCSGYTDDVLGEDSLLRDDVNFLEKPFELNSLLQCVRDSLNKE